MRPSITLLTARPTAQDLRFCRTLAQPLCAAGWRVTVIAPERPDAGAGGSLFLPCACEGPFWREKLLRCVERAGSRLLLIGDARLLPMLPLFCGLGCRTICDIAWEEEGSPQTIREGLYRAWVLRRLSAADAVIARDRKTARRFSECGASPVLVRGFPTPEEIGETERALLRVSPEEGAVCAIGPIGGESGAGRLLRVCAAAGARLLLAGPFADAQERAALGCLPQGGAAEILGAADCETIARACARAQAALIPAGADCRERLWRALAAGLPAVAGSWAASEAAGGSLRVVDETDEAALAAALRQTLADAAGRAQARFGRGAVQRRLSFLPEQERLLRLCEALWEGLQ